MNIDKFSIKNKKKIYNYIPKVISIARYKELENTIEHQKICNEYFSKDLTNANLKIKTKEKELEKLKDEYDLLNIKMIDASAVITNLKMDLEYSNKKNECINSKYKILYCAKGGYTKEINKQKAINEELKQKIDYLSKQNEVQALKIRELASKQEHVTEEYRGNGLPKHVKNVLKNKKRKGEE